jgi:hypothetical protein
MHAKEMMMRRYASLILVTVMGACAGDEVTILEQAIDGGPPPIPDAPQTSDAGGECTECECGSGASFVPAAPPVPAAPNPPLMKARTNELQPAALLSSGVAKKDERLNLYYTNWRKSYVGCWTNDGGACNVTAIHLASDESCIGQGGCVWSNFPEGTYEFTATRVVCGVESAKSAITTVVIDRTCNPPTITFDNVTKAVSGTTDTDTTVTVWGRKGMWIGVLGVNLIWWPTGQWKVVGGGLAPDAQGAWTTWSFALNPVDGNGLYELGSHAKDTAGNEAWSNTTVKGVALPPNPPPFPPPV